jgi:hypothetical protein
MIRGMEFSAHPGILWLAQPSEGQIISGRIVGWETSGERPVPVVAYLDDDGMLDTIDVPAPGMVWIGDSRAEVVESVRRRER